MKKHISGFTLVEMLITIVILTIAAVGLMSFLTSVQFAAEDNLYESTALTVAVSTLEQMKSESFKELGLIRTDGEFNLFIGDGSEVPILLGQPSILQVPVVSDLNSSGAEAEKEIPVTLTPTVIASSCKAEFWIEVEYSYDHPRNGRTRTGVVRGTKNQIPTRMNF